MPVAGPSQVRSPVDEPVEELGAWARPVSLSGEQRLPVLTGLAGLLPGAGLRRGATVAVDGPGGATSLALALLAGASVAGSWVATVGLPSLSLAAAAELGLALERLVLVAAPEPRTWASVVASLVDAVDLVLVRPTHRVRPTDVRRLTARARERGGVLVQVGARPGAWPEATDLHLTAVSGAWEGLGDGHGHLRARRVVVEVHGRREAARPRRAELWLPGPNGEITPVAPVLDVPACRPVVRPTKSHAGRRVS